MQDDLSLAWAAGLFEDEGSAFKHKGSPKMQLKMVREESVRRFASVVGIGTVYGPYGPYEAKDGYERNVTWLWVARGTEALKAASLLYPFLTQWRRDAGIGEMQISAGAVT